MASSRSGMSPRTTSETSLTLTRARFSHSHSRPTAGSSSLAGAIARCASGIWITIRIWQLVIPLLLPTVVFTDRASPLGTTIPPTKCLSYDSGGDAGSVAMSPDGRIIAAGLGGNIVCIWDVDTGRLLERLEGCTGWDNYIAFTPDGKGFVSGSDDHSTLKYWDISNVLRGSEAVRKEMKDVKIDGSPNSIDRSRHRDRVQSLAVSQDGEWIVSGNWDGGVQIWNARTREVQLRLQGHKETGPCWVFCTRLIANDSCGLLVGSIAISPRGGMIASGDWQGRVRICKCTSSGYP
jgi:WD40 repeat protein